MNSEKVLKNSHRETPLQKLVTSICEKKGATRSDMAAKIGTSCAVLSRICSGADRASRKFLRALSGALGVEEKRVVLAYKKTAKVSENDIVESAHLNDTPLRCLVASVCKEKGLTQVALCIQMGLRSRDRLSKICAGVKCASTNFLERLALALGKPLEEVVAAYRETLKVPELTKSFGVVWFTAQEFEWVTEASRLAGLKPHSWLRQQGTLAARRALQKQAK